MVKTHRNLEVYKSAGFAAIGGLLFGYDTGVISGVLSMFDFLQVFGDKNILGQRSLSSLAAGSIVGIMLVGCFLGALSAGPLADRISRKYSIVLFSVVFIFSAVLQTVSINLTMLLLSRLVAGVSVGALSMLVPLYQSEIATKNIRGRLVSLQQWAITIGIAISFWINYACDIYFLGSSAAWRTPLALQMVPALILAIGIVFFPFSPRWLMSKNRQNEALKVLMELRSCSAVEVLDELNDIKNEIEFERSKSVESYSQLFVPPLRRRLILGISLQFLQQLTGINSIMYYAPEIFKQAGLNDQRASLLATGINGIVLIVATIPAILYLDKFGRRLILISGAILMSSSMLIIAGTMAVHGQVSFNETLKKTEIFIESRTASYFIIIFVYVFVASFAFSWGPTAWVYCTEVFPLSMRSKGTSLTTAANWAMNCIVSFLVPAFLENFVYGTYLIFAFFCAAMAIIVYLFYPETKGKSLEDMDHVFGQSVLVVGKRAKTEAEQKFPKSLTESTMTQIYHF